MAGTVFVSGVLFVPSAFLVSGAVFVSGTVVVAVAFVLLHAADYLDLVPSHIARAARSALAVSLLVLMLISWDAYSDLVTSFFRGRLGSP